MADKVNWAERNAAWEARVKALGVERAIYHNGHPPSDYPLIDDKQYTAIIPPLLEAIGAQAVPLTLDYGCGHGRWSPLLANITKSNVIAVDPTESLLLHAQEVNAHDQVIYLKLVNGQMPVIDDHTVDLLWCCMVLSTVLTEAMLDHTIAEFCRVLRPGALVCLTDNTSKVDGRPVRSPYSISRSTEEYQNLFDWCDLQRVGEYEDLGEINTIFLGRVRA